MIVHDDLLSHPRILVDLLERGQYKKFAEIGVWATKTTKFLLRTLPDLIEEYWAIDPWEDMTGSYSGKDSGAKAYWESCREARATEEHWFQMHYHCCSLMTYFPQLKAVKMASEQAYTIFPDEYFDMVFIDAIHTFEHLHADIGYWLPKVRKGGIIGGHDYEHRRFPGVKEAVHKWFGEDIEIWVPGCKVWIKRL